MASLTQSQIAGLWIVEGGPANVANVMAAIAIAESGGDPTVNAKGLYQIDPPEPGSSIARINTKQAIAKYRARGFEPWTCCSPGAVAAVEKFHAGTEDVSDEGPIVKLREEGKLEPSNPVEKNPADPLGSNFLGLGSGGLGKIVELLDSEQGWIRLGKLLIGVFLLLSGVLGMANISAPSPIEVGKKAAKVAAVGAVA